MKFFRIRPLYILMAFQLALGAYLVSYVRRFDKKICRFEKKHLPCLKHGEIMLQQLTLALEQTPPLQRIPYQIKNVPLADEEGIVLDVHNVEIPGVLAPYNASLIEEKDHYLLFFRYDIPTFGNEKFPYHTNIGCVELNQEFRVSNPEFVRIDTKSQYSEDPRVIKKNDQYFVVYNEFVGGTHYRGMRLASLNPTQKKVDYITSLDWVNIVCEKNWMPFSVDENGLHFVYSISPHTILSLPSTEKNQINAVGRNHPPSILSEADWPKMWGAPRGGTPPRLIDGEFLTFFHSSFDDGRGFIWYIMGAYTFEAKAPFKITRISSCPILFKGIYNTVHKNTANPVVRSIYPAGFVVEKRDGKELIQLSCGENDSAVKIITIDKEKLLKSLKPVQKK
jgi:predicted GH43/DUF377 family glycosyl hydrolase